MKYDTPLFPLYGVHIATQNRFSALNDNLTVCNLKTAKIGLYGTRESICKSYVLIVLKSYKDIYEYVTLIL